jgi:integrase/recombinase XerD
MQAANIILMPETEDNSSSFMSTNQKTKPEAIAHLVRTVSREVRNNGLSYEDLCRVFKHVREKTELKREKGGRTLPKLLTEDELKAFFKVVDQDETKYQIMMRFLLYTAIRVNELVNVKVSDVDLGNCKVFIDQGKGSKDRYVLFPEFLRLALKSYLEGREQKYLFQSRQAVKYSPRRIQQIMQEYGKKSGLGDRVHPHLFRHQFLTFATRSGMSDAQIQLISGHASKKSLEVYQHLSLVDVQPAYQQAVKALPV